MNLNERLACLRKEKGLSQLEVAETLKVSRQAISKWESGAAVPSTENLINMSKLYGVSLDNLIDNKPTQTERAPSSDNDQHPKARRHWILIASALVLGILLAASVYYAVATRSMEPDNIINLDGLDSVDILDLDEIERDVLN